MRGGRSTEVDGWHEPWPMPRYGQASLAELLPSVLAGMAVRGESNRLGLNPAGRTCVLLVDGLGLHFLRGHADEAPFMGALLPAARELTAGFPTTTATSLGSIGTGLPPGGHGLLGYQVLVPGDGRLLNLLKWDLPVAPEQWQPRQTVFERAARAAVSTTHVSAEAFRNGGLTRAALRGPRYLAAETIDELATRAIQALAPSPALVYVYFGAMDRAGHESGYGSEKQIGQLAVADQLASMIARAMPADTALYITADHGMIAVPADRRVDADKTPELLEGVAALGGEGRARHVYAVAGAAADVLAAWRELLGERAWVLSRREAIRAGWFGHVTKWATPRIGDVVAACRDDWAVVATVRQPVESVLQGMHGSLTEAELTVPLLESRF